MVICDDPAFLFVHVPKAAGTSIAGALAHVDLMRAGRSQKNPDQRKAWIEGKGFPSAVLDLPIHATAARIKETLGADRLAALFRFAVVRNPWDMELSWYTYNVQTVTAPHHGRVAGYADFTDYVRRHLDEHGVLLAPGPQTKYLFDETGAQIVDEVLRYEDIEVGFIRVMDRLGLAGIELDRFNQSYHAPWIEAYTPETFDLVKSLAVTDADAFGYPTEASAYQIS